MQNVLRLTISQSQSKLQQASTEATTGTYADIGVSLGAGTARTINLTSAIDQAASFQTSNAVVELRMQSAREMSQEFQNLWKNSGETGRLSQDDTDRLVELLREIGDLNNTLMRLA